MTVKNNSKWCTPVAKLGRLRDAWPALRRLLQSRLQSRLIGIAPPVLCRPNFNLKVASDRPAEWHTPVPAPTLVLGT